MTTDYSGIDCPREALCVGLAGARAGLQSVLPHGGGNAVEEMSAATVFAFKRACDKAAVPQAVLKRLAAEYDESKSCVHTDVEDRLAPQAKAWLEACVPRESRHAKDAFKEMEQWLLANASWIFPPGQVVDCLVHGRCCAQSDGGSDGSLQNADSGRAAGQAFRRQAKARKLGAKGFGPLRMNIAGVPCTAWSCMGQQARYAHISERPHAVWLAERKARQRM